LDKGTTDSIMCSEGFTRTMPRLINEAHRVLVPGGRWIMISFADDRRQYFVSNDFDFDELPPGERLWELESMSKEVFSTATLEKVYYIYQLRRLEKQSADMKFFTAGKQWL